MTEVLNSRAFYEIADREISRARRYDHPFTIAYFDLDNFKAVNDGLGHTIGDRLLQIVAQTIQHHLRETDVIARLGGDEFAILLPETGYEPAKVALRKIRDLALNELQKNNWPVTLSIGAVTYATPPQTVDEVLQQADSLMYAVKSNSKNAIQHELC